LTKLAGFAFKKKLINFLFEDRTKNKNSNIKIIVDYCFETEKIKIKIKIKIKETCYFIPHVLIMYKFILKMICFMYLFLFL